MLIDEASQQIGAAAAALGSDTFNEDGLRSHIHPLFTRVLARNEQSQEIYLANHSLGRPLDMVQPVIAGALDQWYERIDGAWEYWLQGRDAYRSQISQLLSWTAPHCIVPKSSAAQGLRAVINALGSSQPSILSTRCEFDSIDFVLKAYHHKGRADVAWLESDQDGLLDTQTLLNRIDTQVDLVVLSVVNFVTGQATSHLEEIVEKAHSCGACVVLDAYHAFGVLPIDFHTLGADFVIGGNYKYTRGGAGACFLAIHPRHTHHSPTIPENNSIFPIDTGWFAKADPFAYKRSDSPEYAAGGDSWLEATPPVLTYFQALPGLMLSNAIGVDRLRAYSIQQQEFLETQLRARGVPVRLIENRGAYILIPTPDGHSLAARFKEAGVNTDARPLPSGSDWVVRLCPDLLNTEAELTEAASRIASVWHA